MNQDKANDITELLAEGVLLLRFKAGESRIHGAEVWLHANADGSVDVNGRQMTAGDGHDRISHIKASLDAIGLDDPLVFVDDRDRLPEGAVDTSKLAREVGFDRVHLHGGKSYDDRRELYREEGRLIETISVHKEQESEQP